MEYQAWWRFHTFFKVKLHESPNTSEKRKANFVFCYILSPFQRVPETDIFVSFYSPENLYYKRTVCFFFEFILPKNDKIYKRWWNLSLDIVWLRWSLLFSTRVGTLVNSPIANEHIYKCTVLRMIKIHL